MRVMRESSWGKLINNQVTRWVGSRQIDMRARGTQKTRTEATCSHKTETQAHGQQTNHQPCAKQDMNTQLMRKLISQCSHKTWQHESTQPIETRTACNTTKHTWTRVCGAERTRDRAHTMTENGARVSEPRHVTETQDMSAGIQTPRSNMKQGTQTREHTRSRALTWKRGHDGSIRALSQNHE